MISKRPVQVEAIHAGTRLDAFILNCIPTSSRSLVLQAIEKKWLTVNGRWQKKGYKVNAGDTVVIEQLLESSDWKAVPNPEIKIPVIHEDAAFLVIDKPAGMPVHPLDPSETNTVINGLLAAYPELAGVGADPLFPAIAHRLDAETSGVMLVARDKKTYDAFRRQFREKRVHKKYVALACGNLRDGANLENWLAHSSSGPHRMLVVEGSEKKAMIAVTEFAVREILPAHALLDVIIRTGVTHQIRCQLAHIGHPLAGDSLYGSKDADAGYEGRLFLHAQEIIFQDPHTQAERCFQAELPGELQNVLNRLRG
jgi:23S rRNA pseudouridine1911/1915/1917 synthase